jgi:hypothetical protein
VIERNEECVDDARRELSELPLPRWEGTKDTLHLWAQIVGKVRMASSAPRNHWWHAPLSVAAFDEKLHATLAGLEIDVRNFEHPYEVPTTTPFPQDREHASYDGDAIERFWPSLDLAYTRFSGGRAPALPDADPVDREAYSHAVISFGFWPGDADVREPTHYSYAAPEPPAFAGSRCTRARRAGQRKGAAHSRSCPTTRFGRRWTRKLHS